MSYNALWPNYNQVPRKHYELFISHSWDYGVDRDSLWQLLINNFTTSETFRDSSAPKDHPIHAMNNYDLEQELINRIKNVGLLMVPAGLYVTYSNWIQVEMSIAKQLGIPILAVHKYGANRSSLFAQNGATQTVRWNGQSIVTAIRSLHA